MRWSARIFFVAFLCTSCSIVNRIDPERAAVTRLEEKKWLAAEASLRKALRKDTLNAEAKFIYARYFLSVGNPAFNADSSYRYTQKTLRALAQSSPKQKERLHKLQIDSNSILTFRSRVDSTAFERARQQNTQQSYEFFIEHFPKSTEASTAVELRDELAYVEALRANTAESFRRYVETFPNSLRAKEASDKYEVRIFEERTGSGRLDDYRAFFTEFPNSAFRDDAERYIFEVSTSSGLIDDYVAFITQYPSGTQSARARNIIYYLLRESGVKRPALVENDSLRRLDLLNKGYWVPFYKNGLYGFMNDDGTEVMAPQFATIDSSYLCGNLTSDFVVTSSGVYSRSGVLLLKKNISKAADLGRGFLSINDGDCRTIVHQSGFQIGDNCVDDARIVADQFIALKKGNGWLFYAFNSKPLMPSAYQDVSHVDKVVILKRYGKNIIVRASQIAAVADQKPLDESLVFDDVRAWGEGNLWVKNGVLEGVIGQDLQFIIPLDRQVLTKTSFGFTRKKENKIQLTGVIPSVEAEAYDNVNDFGDWLELRAGGKSTLYRVSQKKVVAGNLDSVWMKNRVAFSAKNDSLHIYAGSGRMASFERLSPVNFIRSNDSIVYFWVQEKKNRVVYEASQGRKLFSGDFEDIEAIGRDLFVFTKKNKKGAAKKGIFKRDGKLAQPAEYDAIIPSSNGFLSLLKDKKFGLYDTKKQRLIKPVYERNVLPYAGNYFIAYKGAYGIITSSEEPVTGFEFDEIRYWNDTSAWVKRNFTWSICSIKDRNFRLTRIRSFETLQDNETERIVRVQQDNYFGVVSSRKGVVITPTFTEILNIGSDDKPFYFTEKHVEEAGIYVVIYYNADGKLVRKQVYEEEEYGKIYCEN